MALGKTSTYNKRVALSAAHRLSVKTICVACLSPELDDQIHNAMAKQHREKAEGNANLLRLLPTSLKLHHIEVWPIAEHKLGFNDDTTAKREWRSG